MHTILLSVLISEQNIRCVHDTSTSHPLQIQKRVCSYPRVSMITPRINAKAYVEAHVPEHVSHEVWHQSTNLALFGHRESRVEPYRIVAIEQGGGYCDLRWRFPEFCLLRCTIAGEID